MLRGFGLKSREKVIVAWIDICFTAMQKKGDWLISLTNWNPIKTDTGIVWEPELFEKEYFEEVTRLPFCDMQVMVPKEYDRMLTTSYGDYMQLPPKEAQKPQHNYTAYRVEA